MISGLIFCLITPALGDGGGGGGDGPPTVPREYRQAVKAVKVENYTKAIGLLQTVIDKNPKNANAWNYMGYSLRHLKQYDDALAAYQKALKIKLKHKGALENLDKACFFPVNNIES